MKKKIILLLCFIMLTVILTGCSSITIDEAEIEKMTEIADHVANEKGYKLPEGYKVSYENETTNDKYHNTTYKCCCTTTIFSNFS